ncbi:TetR/AcrR family transcriptional regulator [Leucobacter rhizosphaerae]|uniref:TetR/AcrR family transcriptional regulator n=1 Tax=Leucobacter rhizosphaerae TaxID=2932245 RepID=A0ABY4FS88_9MICO|nr:TetR/AcrR family transcriptional regulator [Leucobacter rhizosphaerae]UOQ59130.1 TetR/AcrR family transcriptional regulator [Leucobacter rhizosphaerae]
MSPATASPPPAGRPAGRPRAAVLSRERILQAAFAHSDERGADFTLAALARALGVRPSALHHYFANRDDLIAGMRGQLTLRVGDHGFDRIPWHEAAIPWARAYRDTLGRHPGIIAALATLPVDGEPESIADYNRIAEAFRRDGYPEHRIVPAIVALESFIIGSALDAIAPDDNLRPSRDPEAAPTLDAAERAARAQAAERGRSAAEDAFEFGLESLVAGLRWLGSDAGSGTDTGADAGSGAIS